MRGVPQRIAMNPVRTLILAAVAIVFSWFLIKALERMGPPPRFYPTSGLATWYTSRLTATQERLDDASFTCALRRRDFGKWYKVCNAGNGKCVAVRHNNWGPSWYLFNQGRIVDLTKGAFSQIADLEAGVIKVTLSEYVPGS